MGHTCESAPRWRPASWHMPAARDPHCPPARHTALPLTAQRTADRHALTPDRVKHTMHLSILFQIILARTTKHLPSSLASLSHIQAMSCHLMELACTCMYVAACTPAPPRRRSSLAFRQYKLPAWSGYQAKCRSAKNAHQETGRGHIL